jgi:hypothetical protein
MRALLWIVVAAAVAWGGYWFVGARALKRAAEAWFVAQTDAGLIAERSSLTVQGFPSRFDLTVNDLHLADPATGYGWTAPFVQILALSYRPWHVIAALPNDQQVQTPGQAFAVSSTKLQGSVVVEPGLALTLDRLTAVGENLRFTSDLGWSAAADTLRFATKQTEPGGMVHEIGLEVLGISPNAGFAAQVPQLPQMLDRLHLDAIVTLTAPLDRDLVQTQPHVTRIDLKEVQLVWGPLALSGTGAVETDTDGLAEGRIDVRLTNWRDALPVAVAAGLVSPQAAPTWERMLTVLAAQSGDAANLDLPLIFANGRTSLGPLPLGPAPRLQ